jgi:D-alanyl-D-alanine carboxypeptidase
VSEATDLLEELGITAAYLSSINLPRFKEESELVVADISADGKERLLTPEAAKSWDALKSEARKSGLQLNLYSGFRSFKLQAELIKERMNRGETLEQALLRLAPPGYSEHHSGRAVDITCPSVTHPRLEFESTPEFDWLEKNAANFSFYMSYPKGNASGIIYEPWHWCYRSGN